MDILSIAEIVVGILLIGCILLQERSSSGSALLGGSDAGGFYQARRGFERIIFISTIVLTAAFAALSILKLVL